MMLNSLLAWEGGFWGYIKNFCFNCICQVEWHLKVRAPIIVNQFDHVCPSPTISSPVFLSLSSQLFCPYRRKYAHASFSLSLHHRYTSTLLCMLLLDTTMKCKVVSNCLITSKVWVGFGRNLQIFKNIFFLHLWSIGYKFHTSIQRG